MQRAPCRTALHGTCRRSAAQQASLARSKTSTYATAEATTLDDLQCQVDDMIEGLTSNVVAAAAT